MDKQPKILMTLRSIVNKNCEAWSGEIENVWILANIHNQAVGYIKRLLRKQIHTRTHNTMAVVVDLRG